MGKIQKWTVKDIPDQSGKYVIITGANSGLGLASAIALTGKGAIIIMACRSKSRGEAAKSKILNKIPTAQLDLQLLDLASLDSVRNFSTYINSSYKHTDVLMNNAGIMATPYGKTADGFELQFGTNYLGHFALTGLIIHKIISAPAGRIISISSLAARQGTINFSDLMSEKKYTPWRAYRQSKLANLLFSFELQRKLLKNNLSVLSVAAHPGIVYTNLHKAMSISSFFKKLAEMTFYKLAARPEQGSLPQLFAATADDIDPGRYYGPGGFGEYIGYPEEATIPGQAKNIETAQKLWDKSEKLTGIRYKIR